MKKIIFTILVVFASAMSFTACTEEAVTPTNSGNGGTVPDLT
jgi:hypothetical protein